MSASVGIGDWERAEIERSSHEASHVTDAQLRLTETTVQRYLNPPAATPYPLEYAFQLLGDLRGKVVVDLGCGTGENSLILARRGARVIGFDISESLVHLAERRMALNGIAGGAAFVVASAHELPFATGSVDVIFGVAILHHLDLALVAAESARVLTTGGRGIFQEPVRNSRLIRTLRAMVPYHAPDVSPYERPLTDAELARFASQFSRFRARPFYLPHVSVACAIHRFRSAVHPMYRLDRVALNAYPKLSRYAGIRVIEVVK